METIRSGELPQGREAVAAFAASGQSLKAYCESSGQSEWSMRAWRAEYGEALGVAIKRRPGSSKPLKRLKPKAKSSAAKLIPIVIGEARSSPSEIQVQIRLRGERTVIVPASVEAGLLSRLIGAIERAS